MCGGGGGGGGGVGGEDFARANSYLSKKNPFQIGGKQFDLYHSLG